MLDYRSVKHLVPHNPRLSHSYQASPRTMWRKASSSPGMASDSPGIQCKLIITPIASIDGICTYIYHLIKNIYKSQPFM